MQGSSAFQFGRAAYQAGLLGRRQLLADALANVRFRLRGRHRRGHAGAARADRGVAGGHPGPRPRAARAPTCWPGSCPASTRRCWRRPRAPGRRAGRAYIVTAASQELADILAGCWPSTARSARRSPRSSTASTPARPSGLFVYRAGKAEAIEELAAREGIDLAASYAYSDSESDLPMLRAVGHPVAVNPDGELARIARQEGWEVLRFDRLGRRLKTGAALAAAAAAGGAGSAALVGRARSARAGDGGGAAAPGALVIDCRRCSRLSFATGARSCCSPSPPPSSLSPRSPPSPPGRSRSRSATTTSRSRAHVGKGAG